MTTKLGLPKHYVEKIVDAIMNDIEESGCISRNRLIDAGVAAVAIADYREEPTFAEALKEAKQQLVDLGCKRTASPVPGTTWLTLGGPPTHIGIGAAAKQTREEAIDQRTLAAIMTAKVLGVSADGVAEYKWTDSSLISQRGVCVASALKKTIRKREEHLYDTFWKGQAAYEETRQEEAGKAQKE